MENFVVNTGIVLTYILLGICVAAMLIFALIKIAKNFESSRNSIIGLGILLVIFFISYFSYSGDDWVTYKASLDVTQNVSKLVSASMTTFGILAAISILAIVYAELNKLFK